MIKNAKVVGRGIDPEAYHKRDIAIRRGNSEYVMSQSELMEFNRCPHRWVKGYREAFEGKSKSLEWGSLIDTMLLDSTRMEEKYIIAPETYPAEVKKELVDKPWNMNSNYCKEWVAEHNGMNVIKQSEIDEAKNACDIIMADEIMQDILLNSHKQVMVVVEWHDPDTGLIIPIKGLIDILPHANHKLYGQMIGDLKTSKSANHRAYARSIFDFNYYVQGPFYLDIYEAATGENRTDFFHLVQENFNPYETGRRLLSTDFIELGRERYVNALKRYCQCLKSNKWDGYDDNNDDQLYGLTMVHPEAWMV